MQEQEESGSGQFGEVLAGLDTQSFAVGEKSYAPGLRIPRHEHETVVMSFPLLGSFVESNSFSRYTCERLGLSLNPAGEGHASLFCAEETRCLVASLRERDLTLIGESARALGQPLYVRGAGVAALALRVQRELRSADAVTPLLVEGLVLELLALAIINESAARKIFPDQDPLGQVLITGGNYAPDKCRIVGVVGDVKFGGLDSQADPEVYVHYMQLPESFMQPGLGSMAVVLRGAGRAADLAGALRQQAATLDQGVPVSSVTTMEEVLSGSLAPRRFNLLLLSIFACVALLLAAVGIYGVLSYWVAQRTREIGIRMALGAQGRDIFRLVVFQAMTFVVVGLGVGALAALALARFLSAALSGLLFGVRATDPATFAFVALLLACVALLACFVPARRAVKVEPTTALRTE